MNRRSFIRMLGMGAIATPLLAKFTTRQPVSREATAESVLTFKPVTLPKTDAVFIEWVNRIHDYNRAGTSGPKVLRREASTDFGDITYTWIDWCGP